MKKLGFISITTLILLIVSLSTPSICFAQNKQLPAREKTIIDHVKDLAPEISPMAALGTAGQFAGDWGESMMKNYGKLAGKFAISHAKDAAKMGRVAQRVGTAGVFLGKALIVVPAGLAFLEGSVESKNVEKEKDLDQIKSAGQMLEQLRQDKGKDSDEYKELRKRLLSRAKHKEGDPLQFVKEAVFSKHSLYGARSAGTELICGFITKKGCEYLFKYLKIDHNGDFLAKKARTAWKNWDFKVSSLPLLSNPYVKNQEMRWAKSKVAEKVGTYIPSKVMNKTFKGQPSYQSSWDYNYKPPEIQLGIGPSAIKMTAPSLRPTLYVPPKIDPSIFKVQKAAEPVRAVVRAAPPARAVYRAVAPARPVVRAAEPARAIVRPTTVRSVVRSATPVRRTTCTGTNYTVRSSNSTYVRQKQTCSTCGGRGRITRKVEQKDSEWYKATVDAGFNPDGSPCRHTIWKSRPVTKYVDEDSWCSACGGSGKI